MSVSHALKDTISMPIAVLKNDRVDTTQILTVDPVENVHQIVLNALISPTVQNVLLEPQLMDNASHMNPAIQLNKKTANIVKTITAINVLMDSIYKMVNVFLIAKKVLTKVN